MWHQAAMVCRLSTLSFSQRTVHHPLNLMKLYQNFSLVSFLFFAWESNQRTGMHSHSFSLYLSLCLSLYLSLSLSLYLSLSYTLIHNTYHLRRGWDSFSSIFVASGCFSHLLAAAPLERPREIVEEPTGICSDHSPHPLCSTVRRKHTQIHF